MEVLISVAAKVAEYTVHPIKQRLGYVFFYEDNFKRLKDQVETLEYERDSIKCWVEADRRNGKVIKPDVQKWLGIVDEITEEAKQLCEDPHRAKVGCSKCSFPYLWWRHQLSSKAMKMAKNVANVRGKGKFDRDTISYLPALGGVGSFSDRTCYINFDSRMSIIKKIMRALADPNFSMLGVYGLGGVGKSTLVKEVARQAKEEKLFDEIVIAQVSQTPDLQSIQGQIADWLGLQFSEETIPGRSRRLRERIKGEKSILIILDNIWAAIELGDLGIPYKEKVSLEQGRILAGDDHKGCKVLLTSRSQEVLRNMRTQNDFRLELLNKQETWRLFQSMAGGVVKGPNLHNTATEVAKLCAGLPVLIVTVARALNNNKNTHAWKDALNKLRRVENKELHEITHSALELSYNWLESEEVKELFLLCGVLGPHIQVCYLLKCVLGLGIFKDITLEDARNKLYRMIDSLKASCLLLDGGTSVKVEMHDIVRGVAISIASRNQCVFMSKKDNELKWPTEDLLKRFHQILLDGCHIHKLLDSLDCPELRFFYLYSTNRSLAIPSSFFQGMVNLKMLDLTCMDLSSLPTSFCYLTKLHTLCLDHCALEDMAAIGALKNLEILSLYQSSMTNLPSEIGQLTNLRMLDLSNSGIQVIPANTMSKLIKLEELYMGNTIIKWEVDDSIGQNRNASLSELRQLPNLTALDIQIREAWILPRNLTFEKLERYKIFVGNVWEWFGKYETSKTLKLKLHTSIHLEPGIKALINRVEDLYLDEMNGISNVLYQLNAEGFPFLKHLYIQNNAKVQHIVNSEEWNQAHDAFPSLETLVIHNLINLEKICCGPIAVNSFKELRVVKVKSCDRLEFLFPFSVVKRLSQLGEIDVSKCSCMKMIVFVDTSVTNGTTSEKIELCQLRSLTLDHLPTLHDFCSNELTTSIPMPLFGTKVAFPNLETLKLSSINLNQIWNDDQLLAANSIQNLTNLIVEDCGDLKYLFSSSMVGSFLNLKRLEISKCHMMEEIIAKKEEPNNGVVLEEVRFPKLETITISDMKNLKTTWHYQFDRLKAMEVKNCQKAVIVFPSYMQRNFCSLETLMVINCGSVKEIFELNANEMHSQECPTQLKKVILLQLPKLKQIWTRDPQGILRFHNLEVVHVEDCQNLESLFPLSIAMDLPQLKEIIIKHAHGMKEIVAKKEGSMDRNVTFFFKRLTSLVLWNLLKLEKFYAGNHTLVCPSLKVIFVFNCTKLNLLKTQTMSSNGRTPDGRLLGSMQQSLFTVEKLIDLIPNLEQLTLNNEDTRMMLTDQFSGDLFTKLKLLRLYDFEDEEASFPYHFLKNVPSLEWLLLVHSSFKELFPGERFAGEGGHNKTGTRLKKLTLHGLHELKHICKEGSNIDPVLEVLEFIIVNQCSNLLNLVPPSVSFSHLTYLELENCKGLINLISSTTARSLVKLRVMKITNCCSLEEIVTDKEDEKKDDISFSSLETLELKFLPRLTTFCSSKCFIRFQLLEEVVVKQCPRMQIFSKGDTSSSNLRKVQIEEDDKKWCWEGDLNGTIKQLFMDKVSFQNMKHLNLSEYPELKDLWYGQLQHKVFCNLKSLVVQKCDFLSDVLITSNLIQLLHILEELEVKDCNSIEAVFDMEGVDDKGMQVKETTQLKKLTLFGIPKLKHIWKKASQETITFGNLSVVHVFQCQSLINLFSVSLCQDLMQLEDLRIESCGVKEIVAMEQGFEERRFNFPQLTKMRLCCLTELKSFYPGRHTLECPSLKNLSVYHCNALHIFDFSHSNFQQQLNVGAVDMPIQQALFSVEKVCPNLELLTLNENDAMAILNGHYMPTLFNKVDLLSLQCFHQTPSIFPNDIIQRFLNLVTLQVRCSSFEVLFPLEGNGHQSTKSSTRIKNLWLFDLEQLEYIWNKDSKWDPLDQKLEHLHIEGCSNLANLMPSSTCFKNLTFLSVSSCKQLVYLLASSTAKSLAQLTGMIIKNCEMMENIVHIDEEAEEITFEKLEYLQLTSLSSLKSFCYGNRTFIFPSLVRLIVTRCPKMKIFSSGVIIAPVLRAVELEDGKKRWKDELNTTIKNLS